jgi:mevalonate pyrophosphate decarboxylase
MQSPKASVVEPTRQLTLIFDNTRLEGLGAAERDKIISALAQILMQAAGRKRDPTAACRYAATACGVAGRHFQGSRSSIWLMG